MVFSSPPLPTRPLIFYPACSYPVTSPCATNTATYSSRTGAIGFPASNTPCFPNRKR